MLYQSFPVQPTLKPNPSTSPCTKPAFFLSSCWIFSHSLWNSKVLSDSLCYIVSHMLSGSKSWILYFCNILIIWPFLFSSLLALHQQCLITSFLGHFSECHLQIPPSSNQIYFMFCFHINLLKQSLTYLAALVQIGDRETLTVTRANTSIKAFQSWIAFNLFLDVSPKTPLHVHLCALSFYEHSWHSSLGTSINNQMTKYIWGFNKKVLCIFH